MFRQVEEETGFNCGPLINPEDYIELDMNGQEITLFVIPGVSEDTPFKPLSRKEISVSGTQEAVKSS
jgi:mRNA-decapping enzyme subunit 2